MARSNMRLVIWGMDKNLDLESILTLLKDENYNQSIPYLDEIPNLSNYETTLHNKWTPFKVTDDFEIKDYKINNEDIKYIKARGQYEYSVSEKLAIIDGEVLPRDARVFNRAFDCVFFEFMGRVYAVLNLNSSLESKVRTSLFGQGFKNKKERWGKVEFKNVKPYNLDSNFYYWLFSKRGGEIALNEQESLKLIDVSAVSQLANRNAYDSSSRGDNVLDSLNALSGLGVNQSVYQGGFCFALSDIDLFMEITSDCICLINQEDSIIKDASSDEPRAITLKDLEKIVISLFVLVIPELNRIFEAERNSNKWNYEKASQQRKLWGVRVIKELCLANDITLSDIEKVLEELDEENGI